MPKIPQYIRQIEFTTQASAKVSVPQMDNPYVSATEQIGEALTFLGNKVKEVEETKKKVKQEEEIGRATITSAKLTGDLESEAAKDPDIIGFDAKYSKRIQEVRNASLALVKDPEARVKFSRQLDLDLVNTGLKVKQYGNKKLIEQRKATLAEETASLQNKYLGESNPNVRQQYLDKIATGFTTAAGQGVITKEDAFNSFAKIKAELPEKQARWDTMVNPDYALAELQKGEKGVYPGIEIDKRATLIKLAELRRDKIKNQEEEAISIAQNQKEADLIDLKIAGQIDENTVLYERQLGNISAQFADSMLSAIRSPKTVGAKTDLTVYDEVMTHIINQDLPVSELRQFIIEKHAKGKLSDSDFKHFIYVEKGSGISTIAEDYATQQEKLSRPAKPNTSFWGTIWQLAKKASPAFPTYLMGKIIDRIQGENVEGEQMVVVAKDEVRKQYIKDNPSFANLPQKGKLHKDKYGNTAIIYPDGSYEEVMSAAGDFKHKEQRTKKQGEK